MARRRCFDHPYQFVEEKYKIDMNGLQTSQLNRAIAHGAEEGMFQLPKGPSGKVKLAPKNKPAAAAAATKEVRSEPSRYIQSFSTIVRTLSLLLPRRLSRKSQRAKKPRL